MKIEVGEDGDILFSEVYNPLCIRSAAGTFGICERDGGIEIMRNGALVFACYTKQDDYLELPPPHYRQCRAMHPRLEIRCGDAHGHEDDHTRHKLGVVHAWSDEGSTD